MKSSSSRWLLVALWVLLCAAGCGDDGGDDDADGDSDADSDADADADADADGDGDGDSDADADGDADGDADCEDRPGEATPARADFAMAVDAPRQRLVVFGGDVNPPSGCIPAPEFDDSTWAYEMDCGNWRRLEAAGPSARARVSAALDTARQRMVIFGGRYRAGSSGPYTQYDEVWAFDLATDTWAQVETGDGPAARVNATLVYDAVRDRLVLFGGNTSTDGASFRPQDDTWALDPANGEWTEIAAEDAPDARLFHAAAITPDGASMIVLSGGDENAYLGPFLRDAWTLDLASDTWSALADIDPDARISAMLAGVPGATDLVLFGGHDDGALGNRNDVWRADVSGADPEWSQVIVGDELDAGSNGFCDFPEDFATVDMSSPERRSAGGFAVDPDSGSAYLFGGKTDCGIVNDVWRLDLATSRWTELFPSTGGGGLACLRTGRGNCNSLCF
ncbi:MAG: hypothetical protein HYY06_02185 [Deltaproteobacteria bacterium]|nr:hypothetical protein [Deltaproteobacteria bacterium]